MTLGWIIAVVMLALMGHLVAQNTCDAMILDHAGFNYPC